MPYEIRKNGERWCVHKEGSSDSLGCHDSEAEAQAQMRAIMANESKAVKFVEGSEDILEGYGMPYGGPHNGQDLAGEHFSAKTDFCFEWYKERPLLFHHGLDKDAGTSVIGRVTEYKKTDLGIWTKAQLDKHNEFVEGVKDLVRKGKLFFSSGAMSHLVEKDAKSGELKRWPWVELSTTPTPCNLLATLDFATAKAHFKAIGVDLPENPANLKMMMTKPQMRKLAREMATEMGVEMSGDDMDAMMDKMPAEMEEDAAKEKLRGMMQGMMGKSTDPDTFSELLEATKFETIPLAEHAEGLQIIAASLFERTKDLNQRRVKEGRVLSGANRKRLRESIAAMRAAMDETCAWLDSTEPQPEGKRVDVWRLRVQAKALEINLLNI